MHRYVTPLLFALVLFSQINPEQALAALEARMERDELEAWKSHVVSVIKSPVQAYR